MDTDHDPRTPREELEWRHEALGPRLEAADLDLAVVTSNPNLYYLTGSIQEGMLVMGRECPGPVYMVRRVLERAQHESHLDDVRPAVGPKHLGEVLGLTDIKRLGVELDTVPHAWVERLRKGLGGREVELFDISATLRWVRSVKSRWEVGRIRNAARQVDAALDKAREVMYEGMTELELSAELEREMRLWGHEGVVRMHRFGSEMHVGGVLSGPSAAMPSWHQAVMGGGGLSPSLPHGASRRRIGRGEPVAIDFCGTTQGYIADETRTFVIGGLMEDAQEVLSATQEIMRAVVSELNPGAGNEAVWLVAEAMAEELGVMDGFMGVGPTKMRFIGHGVGLELDELPILADGIRGHLPEGAVVAIEPKVVIPDYGVLGEENTYHLTAEGPARLTNAPPGPIVV